LFVVRKEGEIFAYRDVCPHYGRTRLAWKRDAYLSADGTEIQCSAHGARFRIRDGVCTVGACLGQKLDAVPVEIYEGQVYVAFERWLRNRTLEGRP
jgi:nitrite reductase/ring-hydroxylating ferredoxin subunit